jgi:hypothetical protein
MDSKVITPRIKLGKSVKVKVYSSVHSPVSSLVDDSVMRSVKWSARSLVWCSVHSSVYRLVTNSIKNRI